jgi:hypothetical protein
MTRPTVTSRRARSPRALATRAALAALLTLGVAGCGLPAAVVGIHDAPREQPATAALDRQGAEAITIRVLDAAAKARGTTGAAAADAQAAVLTGTALASAQMAAAVAAKLGTPAAEVTAPLERTEPPKVLAVSRGQQWPRAILASTLDAGQGRQYLHVLVSAAPEQPFKLAASVPMLAGATLPALGDLTAGAPLVAPDDKAGMVLAPSAALSAYAAALGYPTAKASALVATDDQFTTGLRATRTAQVNSLGALASLAQVHNPVPRELLSFRLADGGAVVFARLDRSDTITVKPAAKELVLPANYAKLVGAAKASSLVYLQGMEEIVLVIPATGKATVIGAAEQLSSGTAR